IFVEGGVLFTSHSAFRIPHSAFRYALAVAATAYLGYALWLQRPEGELMQQTTHETFLMEMWGTAGLWLRDSTPPQTLTAAQGAGAIAYYSRRRVIDMFGLSDLHIGHLQVANMGEGTAGHEKHDPAYVLSKQPDYILSDWGPYF